MTKTRNTQTLNIPKGVSVNVRVLNFDVYKQLRLIAAQHGMDMNEVYQAALTFAANNSDFSLFIIMQVLKIP